MSVDDHENRSSGSRERQESEPKTDTEPLQAQRTPDSVDSVAELDARRRHPRTPQGRRRRFLNQRNAVIAAAAALLGLVALILVLLLVYRLGYIDRYVAGQVKDTFSKYGIRAEIRDFHATFPPRTVEMDNLQLFDTGTGEALGKIDRLLATIKIQDLYALSLDRNIDLQDLKIEGLEAWVTFDQQGRSNFRNIHIPPPEPNRRILFAYSTAHVQIDKGVIHYGDARHEISGEARNLKATIQPDNPNAPTDSWMNAVSFVVSNSSFTYDRREVKNIDIEVRGRINQTRAEVEQLTLSSPVAQATLQGTMDDWRALRYQFNINSTVDVTQISEILQPSSAIRGTGNFTGTVSGEGDNYKIDGTIKSDALAAEGIRLGGLNVTANGSGEGKSYDVKARAVADLLTAGDFQLNTVQLTGGVMGTGSDFRWVGELRAAAERSYGTTIVGLILRDARAEMNEGVLTAAANQFNASRLTSSGTTVDGITASDLRVKNQNEVTAGTISSIKAGAIKSSKARVNGVTASKIDVHSTNGTTSVVVNQVQVGAVTASGAETGSINIAGVRLSVRDGRIQGSTADINVGTVKLADGQAEAVKLTRPVFDVEPSGRYRASADLSLGGGVLGRMNLGQARANLVATNTEIQLNNFAADIFEGHASGSASVAIAASGRSRVSANFTDLNIAGPFTALAGAAVPLAGKASGEVDLVFPGTNFQQASGTLNTRLMAETGEAANGRVPISGEVALRADRGLFQIQRVELQTAASRLNASGQFSFTADSNLQVELNSSDASELQNVLISSGLLPDVEAEMQSYGLELGGQLTFSGNLSGKLSTPGINGHVALGSLIANGKDLGSLSASIAMTETELRVEQGELRETDGGGMQFTLNAPRTGENNITLNATMDKLNAANLIAALPLTKTSREQLGNTEADVSGQIKITGIPSAMIGSANVNFGPGRLAGESLESLVARATFSGSKVSLENIEARLTAGRILASGTFDTTSRVFDLQGRAEGVQLARLATLANRPGVNISGTAGFTAHVSGNLSSKDFSAYEISFDGQGQGVTINGHQAGAISLVGKTENKLLNVTLTTSVLGPAQVIAARVNLANDRLPATVETTLNNSDLTNLLAIALPQTTVRLSGHASGTVKAAGNLLDEDGYPSLAGLAGTADFSQLSFRVEDVQLDATTPFAVRFSPAQVSFDNAQFTGPGTNITLGGALAIGAGGRESLAVNGALNLRVLNGLSPDIFSSGTADVAVRVSGSFEQPRLNGTASLTGASLSLLLGNERWMISNLKSVVRFTSDQAQLEFLNGTMGGGRLSASGGARLDGLTLAEFLINVHGEGVTVPFPEDFRSTVDADLEVKGSSSQQLLSGIVNIRRAEYTKDIELANLINFRRAESIEEGGEVEFTRAALFSDLRLEGRNALVVRNNLADLVGSLSLQLNGPVKDPVISGRITATRGWLNFRNDRYEIVRALMDLPARRGADPIVNIQGATQIRGYRVTVTLTGPLSQPQAAVGSDPALPQSDVVSLITTGQLSSGDTSTSILSQSGLGTATSLLTDALINAPAQRATSKLFGLTRFEINPVIGGTGSSPAARLTVGKQINKDLSVTYSTNVTSDPNQILALEYRVSDRLSFVAFYEQASTQSLTTRNNNFSFEIRFRKRF